MKRKYGWFILAIIHLIVGIFSFPLFYTIFIMLTNIPIVCEVTSKHQMPFWYPILYLALMAFVAFSYFLTGTYLLWTKKYREDGLSWKTILVQSILLLVLFVVLPSLMNPIQLFVHYQH